MVNAEGSRGCAHSAFAIRHSEFSTNSLLCPSDKLERNITSNPGNRLVGTKVTQAGADAFLQKHDLKKLRLEVARVGRRIM